MVDKTRDSRSVEAKAFLVMAYRLPSPNRSSKEKTMQRNGGELIEFTPGNAQPILRSDQDPAVVCV